MKRVFRFFPIYFLLLVCCSCAGFKDYWLTDHGNYSRPASSAPKRTRNTQCLASSKLQVTTILKEGILAQLCPTEFPSYYEDAFDACLMEGTAVFLPVRAEENNYVDDQKVTLAEDRCFVEDGVYIHSDAMDKQFQKIIEKEIKEKTGENIDFGDSGRRIRKLKIINAYD